MTAVTWFRLLCDFCGEYEFVSTPIEPPRECHHCARPVEVVAVANGETMRKGLPLIAKPKKSFSVWRSSAGKTKQRGWRANKSSGSLRMVKR